MKKIKKIKIKVNGKFKFVPEIYKISDLLNDLKIPLKKVAIELNQEIMDKKKISKILIKHKPVAIFNLAAETHVDRSIDNPENFIKTNILAVYNFLSVVRDYVKKSNKKIKKFPRLPGLIILKIFHLFGLVTLGPYHQRMLVSNCVLNTDRIKKTINLVK